MTPGNSGRFVLSNADRGGRDEPMVVRVPLVIRPACRRPQIGGSAKETPHIFGAGRRRHPPLIGRDMPHVYTARTKHLFAIWAHATSLRRIEVEAAKWRQPIT